MGIAGFANRRSQHHGAGVELRPMIYVSVVLGSGEWQQITRAAQTLWPGTEIDRQLSRSEICRVFTLAGIDRLLSASDDDRQRVMNNLCRSLQPPADTGNLTVLPGAPK